VRPGDDFDILIEGGEHAHQPRHRKSLVMAAENIRQVGLLDTHELGCCGLCQLARLDETAELHHQCGLELVFLGIGEAEVGEDVATFLRHERQGCFFHDLAPFVALWMVSASRRRCRTRPRWRCGVAVPFVDFFWNTWRMYKTPSRRTV